MWELYAFWTFTPFLLAFINQNHGNNILNESLWSFLIIGIGTIACIVAGYLSQKFGNKNIATLALSASLICCLTSPFFLTSSSIFISISFLLIWSMVVIADSPLLSTIVAQNTSPESKGTALTIVNSLGFSITILSIQTLTYLKGIMPTQYIFIFLAIGPLLGLIALKKGTAKQ